MYSYTHRLYYFIRNNPGLHSNVIGTFILIEAYSILTLIVSLSISLLISSIDDILLSAPIEDLLISLLHCWTTFRLLQNIVIILDTIFNTKS